jgi:hypothetical protein
MSINTGVINGYAINASGAGSTVSDAIAYTAKFSDAIVGTEIASNTDTGVLGDSMVTTRVLTLVEDTSEFSDVLDVVAIVATTEETSVLSDTLDSVNTSQVDVGDTAALGDAAIGVRVIAENLADGGVLGDTLVYGTTVEHIADTAQLTDSADYVSTLSTSSLDTGQLGDELTVVLTGDLADGGVLGDTMVIATTIVVDASEAGVLGDVVGDVGTGIVDVVEIGVLGDVLAGVLTGAVTDVADELVIYEALYSPSGVDGRSGLGMGDVWTCSAATWAMSRHTGLDITSRTGIYAVGPSGLYAIGDTYADSRIQTGHLHFGAAIKKRVPYLYILGDSDAAIEVDVTAESGGVRGTYNYVAKADTTTAGTTVRVNVGKKLTSTYYQFGLEGTGRAEFFGCEAVVDATQRRI